MSDGYLNATDMCKVNNKLNAHYIETNQTKEFLNELASDIGIPISQLVEVRKGNSKKYKQGTWVHPHVAIHLAQWRRSQARHHLLRQHDGARTRSFDYGFSAAL